MSTALLLDNESDLYQQNWLSKERVHLPIHDLELVWVGNVLSQLKDVSIAMATFPTHKTLRRMPVNDC